MKKLFTLLVALSALFPTPAAAGNLLLVTNTNIPPFLATPSSANLITAVTDETGTGALVFAAAPTLTGDITETYSNGLLHLNNTSTGAAGIRFENSGTTDGSILMTPASGLLAINTGRQAAWGGTVTITVDTALIATWNSTGLTFASGMSARLATATPASASAACTTGTVTWDSGFVYVCVATNTWKRAAIATW